MWHAVLEPWIDRRQCTEQLGVQPIGFDAELDESIGDVAHKRGRTSQIGSGIKGQPQPRECGDGGPALDDPRPEFGVRRGVEDVLVGARQ